MKNDEVVNVSADSSKNKVGGFPAGTRVHTKEGLKAIEQIQVGDLVLSKPENGSGDVVYWPVTRVFKYEEREVFLLPFTELDPATGRVVTGETEYVAVTGAHPLWVTHSRQYRWGEDEEIITPVNAWVSVSDIYQRCLHAYWNGPEEQLTEPEMFAILANGAPVSVDRPYPILKSFKDEEGVKFFDGEDWLDGCQGQTVRFGPGGVVVSYPSTALGEATERLYDYTGYDTTSNDSIVRRSGGHLPIRRTVYNLEVAESHSYFVGKLGLWVQGVLDVRS